MEAYTSTDLVSSLAQHVTSEQSVGAEIGAIIQPGVTSLVSAYAGSGDRILGMLKYGFGKILDIHDKSGIM